MKLLQKRQIDTSKADERKKEIDEGLSLARRVDALREAKANEEKKLVEWRASAIQQVQGEIDELIRTKDSLTGEVKQLKETRAELIKPLDKEWLEVNKEKALIKKENENLFLYREQLKIETKRIIDDQDKISKIVSQVTQNEKDTAKLKDEAKSLKELAQREYELAREEHTLHTDRQEKKMLELSKREREYEVAQKTLEIFTNEVKEKEVELLTRERDLARRTKNLQKATEIK